MAKLSMNEEHDISPFTAEMCPSGLHWQINQDRQWVATAYSKEMALTITAIPLLVTALRDIRDTTVRNGADYYAIWQTIRSKAQAALAAMDQDVPRLIDVQAYKTEPM